MSTPLISICIPVYQTERYLTRCLSSVAAQKETFASFEVVLVNDASDGTAPLEGSHPLPCRKLVKQLSRRLDLPVRYIEHSKNRGLVETRRTAIQAAEGDYILNVDSDDMLVPGALKTLYDTAVSTDADIVHGHSVAGLMKEDGFHPLKNNRNSLQYVGTLENERVFRGCITEIKCNTALWGKLFKKELYLKAYEDIPYTETNLSEDILAYFFIARNARRYVGIPETTYLYIAQDGMTSNRTIDTMTKWKMQCSAASTFTILSEWFREHPESDPETVQVIRNYSYQYLYQNLECLYLAVIPELRDEAYALLCDYWGKDFVEYVQAQREK